MDLKVLNSDYELIDYIDSYKSLEWVDRFYAAGDFVITTGVSKRNFQLLQLGNILARSSNGQMCIIESINVTFTQEGNVITAKGRGIESLLDRRIVWTQTTATASETAETFVRRLINENAVAPTDVNRKIPKLKLGNLRGFTEKIEKQLTGDKLLTAISAICKTLNYGYRIDLEAGELVFKMYRGVNRSYAQTARPYVVFSDDFDNLKENTYSFDLTNYCSTALVAGEGEGTARKRATVNNNVAGLNRYEVFVDAKDISSNDGEITATEYNKLLTERGNEKLAEHQAVESFDGITDDRNTYVYGQDYYLGDIVQIENDLGLTTSSRIIEVIESYNENGYRIVPTFETWEVERGATWQF